MYKNPDNMQNSIFPKIVFLTTGLFIGFIVAVIFFGGYRVSDKNMSPALEPGDYIFINRFKTPLQGDVVLIESPLQNDRYYLTRVVAVQNSVIKIENKILYVNYSPSNLPFVSYDQRVLPAEKTGRDNLPEIKVAAESIFVIGDNWDYSYDSRYFGDISLDLVKGVVFLKM